MPFIMQPAQFPLGGYPEGDSLPPTAGVTYVNGTPVTVDANGLLAEHALGATVTNIKGVALEGVTAGVTANPDGRVSFAHAGRGNIFMAKFTNGSGVVQAITQTLVNEVYGIIKVSSGATAWFAVDQADTTDVVVEILGFSLHIDGLNGGVVFFKFIESAIQNP